ncbi:MAG TPA: folylpolyglutamate synthase/dihydrofolate synthase family protein [Anaerolineae bacterium]|nr:folylpolyglutamate synthase/dihydrofolate synthase family protein [Anaerolineae bacterium]
MYAYIEALEYLNRFINYERQRSAPYSPETLNLERMRDLLARLGNPQQAYPTIHIAGTKGKGSTAALIEAILRAAGYRTGLYTSPHLHTFRERMRVGGAFISREAFAALVDEIEPQIAAVAGITWFEIVTALAFLHFARSAIDLGVIEVGLGGRFDATNVLRPRVSAITSLSLDHTAWLGGTLDRIAFEKGGIIKPGVPVVSAPQPPEALAVIERIAQERGAPLTVLGSDVKYAPSPPSPLPDQGEGRRGEGESFTLHGILYRVALTGRHQIDNAALAITTIKRAKALAVSDQAIERGLEHVRWPGRFEIARRDPPLVFDGAHNADSAAKLTATLEEVFPDRRWTLIFGASSDKDIHGMFERVWPITERVIVTRAQTSRAADLEAIAQLAADRQRPIEIASDVKAALEQALALGTATVVTGSLYIVAEARVAWLEHTGQPPPERDI